MNRILLAGLVPIIAATPAQSAQPAALSAAAEKDAQCFVLYMAAVGGAKDDHDKQGAVAGTWYFLGKLEASAPGVDLVHTIQHEADVIQGSSHAHEIGAACDSEFQSKGAQLMDVGQQAKKTDH